ncbi:MAG: tRNA 2-thiocytidine(32) synthetase TtcA [Hungatella sp.]|jgi:tRNA 2-thiocytidine biosynthesis protein TtcA|nr:tRNA 2-thiocytidine(32) synthetase TtcA [Hungatella sp.]
MHLQRLLSLTRQAVDAYGMIDDNDKIAVGISGGKDSLTLLYALNSLKRFYPKKFDIYGITVDLGFEGFSLTPIKELCEHLSVPYKVISTDIGHIVFQERRESGPCSLCAKLRKGALNKAALDLGCNKVAYGHHKNDMVETMLLSLIYEGRFYCFPPKTYLDRTKLTLIRPLMYVEEADIKGFCNRYQVPLCKNPCPADGFTKREYVKNLTKYLEQHSPGVRQRMFHAITTGDLPGWPAAEKNVKGPTDMVTDTDMHMDMDTQEET